MKTFKIVAITVFTAVFVIAGLQAQQTKRTAAVWEFKNTGGIDKNEISTLTNRFRNYLVSTNFYKVLEREKMEAILKEQDFTMTDNCNSAECAVEVGKLLGVERMVAGEVGKMGQVYTIDVRIIDVSTGEILKTQSQNHKGGKEGLLDVMEAMAYTMVGKTAPKKAATTASAGGNEKEDKITGKTSTDDTGDVIKIGTVKKKYGTIEINCEMDGTLYLDGKEIGEVSEGSIIPIEKIKTGPHTIEIKASDDKAFYEEITVEYNKTTSVTAKAKKIFGKPAEPFTDYRDGKTYKTVKINNKIWLAENLNYDAGDGCYCYGDQSYKCDEYGRLYTWEAAKRAVPQGWRLPTKSEFEDLIKYIGGESSACKELIPGGGARFHALFGGWRNYDGDFDYIGKTAYFWSASEYGAGNAWSLYVDSVYQEAGMYGYIRGIAFSVRLLKD